MICCNSRLAYPATIPASKCQGFRTNFIAARPFGAGESPSIGPAGSVVKVLDRASSDHAQVQISVPITGRPNIFILRDFNSTLCVLKADGGQGIVHTFGRQALPMLWDFAEANPFNLDIASWASSEVEVFTNIGILSEGPVGNPTRGS